MTGRIVGIVGGMGPAATVELYRRLTEAVPAQVDQDHPRILIDSHARIPDRTLALTSGGEDPEPYLLESVRLLERAGADVLIMPCNTAHAYLPRMREVAGIPILDMVGATAASLADRSEHDRTALLATDGTLQVGIYPAATAQHGIDLLVPSPAAQQQLMAAIALVKAGAVAAASPLSDAVVADVAAQGATRVLLGCTELSVLAAAHPPALATVDPLDVLVDETLAWLGVLRRPAGRTASQRA